MCDLEQMVPEGGMSILDDNQRIEVEQTLERALAAADGHVPNEMRLNSRLLSVLFKKKTFDVFGFSIDSPNKTTIQMSRNF
ncbi:hypothetical protein DPMN_049238 [Dreissena polymorpha]|uniref:Uncharacterized protein n=1 Tax=Dreissena polymorpha TaxID=45954 RepID=A0A9D4CE20_DREPO|nr:hypothetical protein DPMN_049238 [Dreissena polymorpha]